MEPCPLQAEPENPGDFDYEAALAACAAGDRVAFRRLYEQEAPRLLGVALRIVRQRALAEDIVHDACVSLWTRAASFDASRGSARGWIYSVVRNLALNTVRNESRHVAVDEETTQALEAEMSMQA
ncbi:MAG: sigma-70 family RNA polymerase sigma factor, partial [Burkholderiaceae bacterium]|nr:sigma-70 family RNA polymerase sigma factor [Burkholderiaceae bacterium]